MNSTQKALCLAVKSLRHFKRAAMDAEQFGWELKPQELWEPGDEDALAALEQAMAKEKQGLQQPLFGEIPA